MNATSIPATQESELAVLGAIIVDDSDRHRADIFHRLNLPTDDMFVDAGHRALFDAMHHLHGKGAPIEPGSILDRLNQTGNLATMPVDRIADIISNTGSPEGWEYYAGRILDAAQRRRLCEAGARTIALAKSDQTPLEAVQAQSEAAVFGCRIEESADHPQTIGDMVVGGIEGWERALKTGRGDRIKTGAPWIDSTSGGWRRGELNFIAARPSIGKTATACNTSLHFAKRGHGVYFFSLEMSAEEVRDRFMCAAGAINGDAIADGRYSQAQVAAAARRAADTLSGLPIMIDGHGAPTVAYMRSRLREHRRKHPLDLVVIDYIQLMRADGKTENRNVEIGNISRDLKLMAKEFRCVVLVLSQLNRGGAEEEPMMHHLRDSGSLEQDADQIGFLWREKDNAEILNFRIAKNRNGRTGECQIHFDRSTQTMTNAHVVRGDDGSRYAVHTTETTFADDGGAF